MLKSLLFVALLLEFVVADLQTTFLAAHNKYRKEENAGLGDLSWDTELASLASKNVGTCRFQHDSAGKKTANFRYIGQNLFFTTRKRFVSRTSSGAVAAWVREKANYDLATNSCKGVCGHYTQVVWRSTTHVGCAVKVCSDGDPRGGTFVACNYGPGGNYRGQKPY